MTDQQYWTELGKTAAELFSRGDTGIRQWRRFLCACYRRIEEFAPGPSKQRVVEVAEQFIAGSVSRDDLAKVCREAERDADEAWRDVLQRKLPDSWSWPLSDEVDAAWVRYLACSAAKETVQPELRSTVLPDAAAGARAWALARRDLRERGVDVDSESARDRVQQEWNRLNATEQEAQLQIMLGLIPTSRPGQVF